MNKVSVSFSSSIHIFVASVVMAMTVLQTSANASVADITFVDNSTLGYYNYFIGVVLDKTNPFSTNYLFPGANLTTGDPLFKPVPEPDLSFADPILGQWLDNPPSLNALWSGPQLIPSKWSVNTETAMIYEINAGTSGICDVVANIGVDNGVFVWLDGIYQFGALAPGGAVRFEYSIALPDMGPGTHYLQILREDHGVVTDFAIQVTGVPEPGTVLLVGLGGLALLRKRRV